MLSAPTGGVPNFAVFGCLGNKTLFAHVQDQWCFGFLPFSFPLVFRLVFKAKTTAAEHVLHFGPGSLHFGAADRCEQQPELHRRAHARVRHRK